MKPSYQRCLTNNRGASRCHRVVTRLLNYTSKVVPHSPRPHDAGRGPGLGVVCPRVGPCAAKRRKRWGRRGLRRGRAARNVPAALHALAGDSRRSLTSRVPPARIVVAADRRWSRVCVTRMDREVISCSPR